MTITCIINGEEREFVITNAGDTLSSVLREEMVIMSVHEGCRQGWCGHCMVLLDGNPVPSCLTPLHGIQGAVIETIEGLVSQGGFADIERGFMQADLNPCPHCSGIKAILAEGLLRLNKDLQPQDVMASMPRHWCQCSPVSGFVQGVLNANTLRRKRGANVRK